jgi:hypothetical protein
MSNVKKSTSPEGLNLYYSDTDSAIVDQPLPSNMVSNKLGHFKLEQENSICCISSSKSLWFNYQGW